MLAPVLATHRAIATPPRRTTSRSQAATIKKGPYAALTRDGIGGLLGVLGAHIFWDWAKQVEQSVLSPTQEAGGIELLIISADDQVLLGPPGLQGTLLEPSLTAKATHATQPSGSVREWPDGRSDLSTAVVAPGEGNFHGLGWTVVAREPLAQTTQSARDVVLIALAAGACLSLLIGSFTWLLLRLGEEFSWRRSCTPGSAATVTSRFKSPPRRHSRFRRVAAAATARSTAARIPLRDVTEACRL